MSSGDSIQQRGNALENQFFAKVDQELVEKLRQQLASEELGKSLGITDPKLGISLVNLGLTASTCTAIRLAPLVAVAWADGSIEPTERKAVLDAAATAGIPADSPALKVLANWLAVPPSSELLSDWCQYVSTLLGKLGPTEAEAFRQGVINGIKNVAQASGGVLGWGTVSDGESKIMKTIEAALKG